MNALGETEKAYLAGLMDGEGCIHIAKQKQKAPRCDLYTLHVVISQGDELYLQKWSDYTGVGKVYKGSMNIEYMIHKYAKNVKQCYQWRISATQAGELLKEIYPYLLIKREQACLALEFQATKGEYNRAGMGHNTIPAAVVANRERIRNAILALNKHASREPAKPEDR